MQLIILKVNGTTQKKGDIIELRATSTPFGGSEPDTFVMVECPEPMDIDYGKAWNLIIDYEIISSNPSIDEYRLRLFSTLVNSLNYGVITRDQVETFINNWGGTVFSFGTNEVIFDITIFDAIKSKSFWQKDTSGIVFIETNYDQGTGVHTIEADYSALSVSPTYIETLINNNGATVTAHSDRVITFDIARSVVREAFELDIKTEVKKQNIIEQRRYYVNLGVVDFIIGQGGTYQTDFATLSGYIHDKVSD